MSSWVKPVAVDDVKDGVAYFLSRPCVVPGFCTWYFYAKDIKGKAVMSTKPGIAMRFSGGDAFKETLRKHPDLKAIEVPPDADTRWRRRKRRLW